MSGETSAERTRRRWVSLAETVGVVGVLIAAVSLWLNWSDHRTEQRDRAAEAAATAQEKGRFDLRGTVSSGGDAVALQRDERHELRDVRITFPSALGIGSKDAVDQTIPLDWFDRPLRDATAGKGTDHVGRLPVLVRYTYSDGDAQQSRTGIYDIVWLTRGRFLRGRALSITGFRSHAAGGTQTAIDALWTHEAK